MAKKKAKKKKLEKRNLTLRDVILSFPHLGEPKTFKGNSNYETEVLFSKDKNGKRHRYAQELDDTIYEMACDLWGDDESEWPEDIASIKDGNEKKDQKGYKGREWIKVKTSAKFGPFTNCVDFEDEWFDPSHVRGGMFADVAVIVAHWENEEFGTEGISVYLEGVAIDTEKDPLPIGGGRSTEQMFDRGEGKSKKKKSRARDDEDEDEEEDEDEAPRKSRKSRGRDTEDEDEEEAPKKRRGKPSRDEDDEDEDEDDAPRSKRRASRDEDEDDEEDAPRARRKKKPSRSRDDEETDEDDDED